MISGTTKFEIEQPVRPLWPGAVFVCELPCAATEMRDVGGLLEIEFERGDFIYLFPQTGRVFFTPHRMGEAMH